jgi:hypothetical protein
MWFYSTLKGLHVSQGSKQPTILRPLSLYGVLALAGIASPIIFIITNIIAAFSLYPGYNFIRDSISSIVWTPSGWVQTIGFTITGLLIEAFILGLLLSVRKECIRVDWHFRLGASILVFFGFGMLLVGAFHTDPADGPDTIGGTIHGVVAAAVFWLFPIAGLLIASCLRNSRTGRAFFSIQLLRVYLLWLY